MINWTFYPHNKEIPAQLKEVVDAFSNVSKKISSFEEKTSALPSNSVLSIVRPNLEKLGYEVEKRQKEDGESKRICVPVLYGKNGQTEKSFVVDAYSESNRTVVEVEAGRGVTNYQFLKDFYEACMMSEKVSYFCVAVKNKYQMKSGSKNDYDEVCKFFEAWFLNSSIQTPLDGVLVIGY